MELNEVLDRMRHQTGKRTGEIIAGIIGAGEIGDECSDLDCDACRGDMFRRLADEVEAAAFGGLPPDTNGERLMLGGTVCTDEFGEGTVVAVSWKGKACVRPSDAPSGKGGVWMRATKTAHTPRPVSGDLELLAVGSRVWLDGAEHVVYDVRPTRAKVAGRWINASELATKPPELVNASELAAKPLGMQERINADALKSTYDYWRCGARLCHRCPSRIGGRIPREHYGTEDCTRAKTLDLLRRQRELDAKEAGR